MSRPETLADRWFRPKAFERDGRLYRWLGVVAFKRVLTSAMKPDPASPTGNAYVLGGRSLEHVRQFERKSRRSEAIHLAGLAMGLLFLVLGAVFGDGLLIAGIIVVAANFHCFALQRYNRARVWRVLERGRDRPRPAG